ncbi:MAG: lamin tail domain-containing protein [Calditrichaceae bacterium]|nr:lamin tail domain-containing protein [Calditrichaceae bacterium]RQV91929.1 MAG: hypothetical protein EH224_17010 [Calditrichota bacterium]
MIARIIKFLLLPLFLLAQDHLYITEVMIPPETSASLAFVEIYNAGDAPVSLADYYLANYNSYYRLAENVYSSRTDEFLVRFPDMNIAAGQALVIALNGAEFYTNFFAQPDFEIKSTDAGIPDMQPLWLGSAPKLDYSRGMIILFHWDGQSDLVQDADYMPWGLLPFNSWWMDKTGVSIDGPDDNSDVSEYLADLTKSQQKARQAPGSGLSLQRQGLDEVSEVQTGGNGLTGHNEATEDWTASFISANPAPGSFSPFPGDGAGTAVIYPDTVETNTTHDFIIQLTGSADYTITNIEITVPDGWTWGQSESDVTVSGDGASGCALSVDGQIISLTETQLTDQQLLSVTISGLTSPAEGGWYPFKVQTSVSGGNLTQIAESPGVDVQKVLTIREVLENFDTYNGQTVTLKAVVAIGAGITRTDRTDAYIQDGSGRGLNVSAFETDFPDLVRGNLIKITGEISEYQGDPQIQYFETEVLSTGNEVPAVGFVNLISLSTPDLKGAMIKTAGVVQEVYTFTDGNSNITIYDPTGDVVIRVWQTTGIDISGINTGDTLGVQAVVDEYNGAPQLLVGYQYDLYPGVIEIVPSGSGVVTVSPDSVGLSETASLNFSFSATSDQAVSEINIEIPSYWGWSGSETDVQLDGSFAGGDISVNTDQVFISNVSLLPGSDGSVSISNLQTPAVDTASVFNIRTASAGGILTAINNNPVILVGKGTQMPVIPIAQARLLPEGTKVTVKGVVTIGSGILRSSSTNAYIQDNSGRGINLYKSSRDADVMRGNLLIVTGVLEEYANSYDDIVLEITDYTVRILKTNADMPEPLSLSPYKMANLGTEYEGTFVEVQGKVNDLQTDDYGQNLIVADNSGAVTCRINIDTGIDLSGIALGNYIKVRGIIGFYRGDVQVTPGYQDHIEIFDPSTLPGKDLVSLKLPNKPFVPESGEKLKIEYTIINQNSHVTIRIFDLAGRMVYTLFDGIPYDIDLSWNGRNHINELAPVGTYICHLEVVDNDTGDRQVRMAPIVIGTVLKR